ncbi:MAG: HEPN domain-containing protein [Muribaculaceae bacterium]|nr:HEPN domain-containing protein [Muribaculaceae bacterium]
MSLSDENKNIAIKLLVEKSDRNFQQALANSELGYWDLVANRLYYSVFHAVTALMLKDGVKVRSHKGTSAMFGQHYVLTGKFDREEGILYSRLQTMREKADYQNVFSLEVEEGKKLIALTEALLIKIKTHLS